MVFFVACSRKSDKFINRNWHAMTTRYNTLYNGEVSFIQGKQALVDGYEDNYWEQLPIERLEIRDQVYLESEDGNPDFLRAEEKAAKAIQRHSMNINGRERNFQTDEAFMLLGKARYYDQRFVQALEAFNYILSNYPTSNNINNAKIWKAKTFIRLENEESAIKVLNKVLPSLLKELTVSDSVSSAEVKKRAKEVVVFDKNGSVKKRLNEDLGVKKQVLSDASAMLAQAYINLKHKDSAIAPMKLAVAYTKNKEEKGRYHYILGQLYNRVKERDSANMEFDKIIKLNRRTSREYLINAYLAKARNLEIESEDQIAFLEILDKLEKNWENRPFLDKIYYEKAIFFFGNDSVSVAEDFYKKSLSVKGKDNYLNSLSYETLSRINFDRGDYDVSGKYMDSTLSLLAENSKRKRVIQKKRDNLEDVLKFETISTTNDSILRLARLTPEAQQAYFKKYTDSLKQVAIVNWKKQKNKQALALQQNGGFEEVSFSTSKQSESSFYFYNPNLVASGLLKFERIYGKRELVDNWKVASRSKALIGETTEEVVAEDYNIDTDPTFDPQNYISKIPTDAKVIDSLVTQRNEADFQLGIIYKEQLKEYDRATTKFETLLQNEPEEKYILPSKYNLYKIYQSNGNFVREERLKNDILTNHPKSRYAQILKNSTGTAKVEATGLEQLYANIYKLYESQEYEKALEQLNKEIQKLDGDPIVAKFQLLKAYTVGKTQGVDAMSDLLKFVSLTYPRTESGKKATELAQSSIPYLQRIGFENDVKGNANYKLLYGYSSKYKDSAFLAKSKLDTLIKKRNFGQLNTTVDYYTKDTLFLVVHGLKGAQQARSMNALITDDTYYETISRSATKVSSNNYKVIQLRKNYGYYLKYVDSIN